jgi:hypothetical protein
MGERKGGPTTFNVNLFFLKITNNQGRKKKEA